MSAVAPAELDLPAPPARRPGTAARFAVLLLAALGTAVVFAVGFPRGAPDRFPVLLLSLGFALDAVFRPSNAIRDFCYVFPLAGLAASMFGSTDPVAWPLVLFGGLAVGWTFRFLYDFDSAPDPSPLDSPLRALVALWAMGTLVAIIRARTLWELVHGVGGRAVNSEGLAEAAAIRGSLLTFAVLAAGAGWFFLLRRSGAAARSEAVRAALVGAAISATVAVFQAIGVFPGETRPFWKLTGRLSGGATDPNALGLLCGLATPVLLSIALSRARSRWALVSLLAMPVGLVLSGSRSGFLLAILGGAAVVALAPAERRRRSVPVLAAAALLLAVAGTVLVRGSPGDVGERLGHLFRSSISLEDRVSSRPMLWRAALRLHRESPVEGGGVGSFAWRLPDVAGADRGRIPIRDNPGSAYLQALAETGIAGLALTLAFVWVLGRQAVARARERTAAGSAGAAAAILAFLLVLLVGSHWLAPDVAFLFFLLAALVGTGHDPLWRPRWLTRLTAVLLFVYAVFALRAAATTLDPAATFRYGNRTGFHGREAGPDGPFRWTRRRFALWVTPGESARLSLANSSPEGKPVGLVVTADGRESFRRTLAPGERVDLALRAGGRARAFEFELSRSFVPKRFGLADRRDLGVVAVMPEEAGAAPGR